MASSALGATPVRSPGWPRSPSHLFREGPSHGVVVAGVGGHFGFERGLEDGFGDLLEQAVFTDDVSWLLVACDELVDELLMRAR